MRKEQKKDNENNKVRQNVLLIGSGVYRDNNYSWNSIIEKYVCFDNDNVCIDEKKELIDNMHKYNISNTIKTMPTDYKKKSHKKRINYAFNGYNCKNNDSFCEFIHNSNIKIILTTNYTYDIERNLDIKLSNNSKNYQGDKLINKISREYVRYKGSKIDKTYLIHTFNKITTKNEDSIEIWHIHGELRNSDSIVLSHYGYGSNLGKITEHCSKIYNDSNLIIDNKVASSWIDYFLFGNVYILGFSFDFSEFDLWWLLEKRFNLNDKGKMYFYELKPDPNLIKNSEDKKLIEERRNLLESKIKLLSCVDVCSETFDNEMLGKVRDNNTYNEFYKLVYNDIESKIK